SVLVWWAIDHNTGVSLVYCFGVWEHRCLGELRCLFAPFRISIVCCDENVVYKTRIAESIVASGKRNAQCIERKHLSLRIWCSRLVM
ncbi:MAG: IS1 family transposase, partial [Nitrososphaerota archaeon]|nr:IS1 family transposase [Nitrososphaerota archaeon]